MKPVFKKNLLISIFWLVFFLVPFLLLVFPPVVMDFGWFYLYFIVALPVLFIACFFIDKFFINKQTTLKEDLVKYFLFFVASYAGLIAYIVFNLRLGFIL